MAPLNPAEGMRLQITESVRRLLSEQDRDPYSPTCGCFDRRYWGWKLVDFPEATFQRNVHPLALLYADPNCEYYRSSALRSGILAGLRYAAGIQHLDGSFDQAFPHEHSFGATAFLLHSLLEAFKLVADEADGTACSEVERCLRRAAEFLCWHDEGHGHIANHLAGAVLSLLVSAEHFGEIRYRERAEAILESILKHRSPEGWFLEYEGADPGYQTLCLYYLAQVYQKMRSEALWEALDRAITFIAYFVHPDGTFAGEYGSRRTAVFYPGGVALLSREFPTALSIAQAMCRSICSGHTVTLRDMDMGNLAPLLLNYICALQSGVLEEEANAPRLPWEQPTVWQDFPQAGLYIRGTERYYAVLGVSNGGVFKVFDKPRRRVLWDDGGYVGQLVDGTLITTQMTVADRPCTVGEDEIEMTSCFYGVLHSLPTPFRFVLLRLLNLTLMRSLWLGNWVKKGLVRLLISGKRRYAMQLERRVQFWASQVVVEDRLSKSPQLKLAWLEFGRKFVSIHMASARYFEGAQLSTAKSKRSVDIDSLSQDGCILVEVRIPELWIGGHLVEAKR
jgi:hypothetical protein